MTDSPSHIDVVKVISRKRSEIESSLADAPVFQVQEIIANKWRGIPGLYFTPAEAHAAAEREGYRKAEYRLYALAARGKLASILQAHTEEDT